MDGLEANRIISSRETPTKKPLIVALTANTDRDTQVYIFFLALFLSLLGQPANFLSSTFSFQDLTVTEGFFDYLQKPLHIPSMARVLRESYKVTKKASAPPPPSSS
jgi:CheY-like chemotaxis protein